MKKKILCCLLAVLCMLSALPAYAADVKWAAAGESDQLKLYLDTKNVILGVQHKKTGMAWYTSPQDRASDTIAQGAIPNDLGSMLLVSYVDQDNVPSVVSARAGSIAQGTVALKKMKNGQGLVIEFTFSRKKEGFMIPLRITAEGNALRVEIQYEGIVENGPGRITEIALLPYFGAGNEKEEGFALIPDGSGATISFRGMKPWAKAYRARVYGTDTTMNPVYEGAGLSQVYLPVFGLSREKGTVLGVITQGDENAWIEAVCPGITSGYAAVWPTFIYRQTDVTVLADNTWKEKQINVTGDRVENVNPVVYYYFSPESGIGEMARLYRGHLKEKMNAKPRTADAPSLVLEVFGVTQKAQSVAGVVQETQVTATTFAQAAQMAEKLSQAGIDNAEMQLFGFLEGGMYYADPGESRWNGLAGGEKGFRQLKAAADKAGIALYTAADAMNNYQGGSLAAMGMAPRRLDNSTAWQYAFALSTGNKNTESKWFAIRPGRLADVLQRLQKGLDGTAGLLLLGYGDTLYGDWGADEYITRVQAEEMISDALRGLPEERPLALCGANLYGALIAGRVAEAPLHSSGYDLTDGDVPFYSMVMGEFAILSSVPLNALGDGALLSCMAAGMAPAFRVTGDSPAVYGESRLNFLYNSRFDARWKDMTAAAAAWKEVQERTEGSLMTFFERQGDVSISTYENGVHLAVNHGTEEAAADGRTIPAGGWLIY